LQLSPEFRQRRIRASLQQLEQALLAGWSQVGLAPAPVSLRLERAAFFEVLADPAHGGRAVTEAAGDLVRILA
jgi:hypothetical protein